MNLGSHAAAVAFHSVSKTYGEIAAVREVSFVVEAGTLVTLLGPSGCGKTTTLRLVAGLEMATAGAITIGSEDVTRLPATDRDVTMVFQSYALFPHMTVLENVAYGMLVSGMPKAQAFAAAEEGLALVGLTGYGARLPSELSGGQQQRVAVARAVVLEPSVLLFDEPLSNLDAKLRRRVREEIRELQQKLALTAIYVTHDQEEALAVSDKIIVMRDAGIAQIGTPRQLYEEPVDAFVADFIGDANLLAGNITALDGELAVVNVGGIERRLPHRGLGCGAVQVVVRPEAIRVVQQHVNAGIEGRIKKATYLGNHIEYFIDCPLGELFAIDHRLAESEPAGAKVTVLLAEQGVTLLKP